eukprot:CAMPEP_0183739892 /NCGR_PEP_ID=MMETSP0737-20130205/58305_1 /TAXON_ID=385413 /ORGANISM="Thalassiosira miniscula, Strain CCMP1093" /LENGTH=128 /DNA_ID=CAMNT_0025974813 /DNA_START=167 /DNA_END=550 /DNA_ORIENTATION=-
MTAWRLLSSCSVFVGAASSVFGGTRGGQLTVLHQQDFENGTYRITEPGIYKLGENIDFGPLPSNDYWPTFASWGGQYPPSTYYLGFFAAITVEADDVTINLDGHTIQQTEEFYLLQRFFNVVELNDRA